MVTPGVILLLMASAMLLSAWTISKHRRCLVSRILSHPLVLFCSLCALIFASMWRQSKTDPVKADQVKDAPHHENMLVLITGKFDARDTRTGN